MPIQKKPLKSFTGRLVVITGVMYSQKSTTSAAYFNKNTVFEKKRLWVKPDRDDRKANYTETHDKSEIPAYTINAGRPDQYLPDLLKARVIVFDEVQFFSERIIYVIHRLLEAGCLIIINGLRLTAARNHFGMMPYLLAEADDIISLKSVCNICLAVDSATRTKAFNVDTPSVSTGGTEKYYVTCSACDGSEYEARFLKEAIQKARI
jgi:thymidine kinase